MKKVLPYLLLLLCAVPALQAQVSASHLGSFDNRKVHLGIQVGYTQSKFDLHYSWNDTLRQTIIGTSSYYSPGFHINAIGELRLSDHLGLRFLPGITLISRDMSYRWSKEYTSTHWKYDEQRTVESVYWETPLELKYRANRYNNFRPYLTAGVSWGFDFASLWKNQNNNDESIIRLNLNDLRFIPSLSFIDRSVVYNDNLGLEYHQNTNPKNNVAGAVYMDLPLMVKLKSSRIMNNIRAYVLAGAQYSLDLTSIAKKRQNNVGYVLRLYPHDFQGIAGVGFDFYCTYFKFAAELKMAFGFVDLKVNDDDYYSQSADYLISRTFMLSFTFES